MRVRFGVRLLSLDVKMIFLPPLMLYPDRCAVKNGTGILPLVFINSEDYDRITGLDQG